MTIVGVGRRALALLSTTVLCLSGCGFEGVNSLPLPGTVGQGSGASTYTVQMANVGTLEQNSPVLIDDVVVGSIRRIGIVDRHAEVEITVAPGVRLPANAAATVGQTSLLGSMHLQIAAPVGQTAVGFLEPGATVGLDRTSTYPSTEQTLAALSAVVNAGGLGQIGDIIHSFNAAFDGRQGEIRELIGRLDTFVGALNDQRDNIVNTVAELDRLSATLAGQKDIIVSALRDVRPALDVLVRERPRFTAALEKLRAFSDTATGVVDNTTADLITNLEHLEPTIRALVDVGPDISTALAYAPVFPLGQNFIDRGIRGDYMNLFVTVDLTLGRLKRGLLAGTSFGDENAPLVPAPGDPGYDSFYLKNAAGEAVAPPVGVLGPEQLPPRPPITAPPIPTPPAAPEQGGG